MTEYTLDDVIISVPDKLSKGYLRRQLQIADRQMGLIDVQAKVSDAQELVENITKKGDKATPKDERDGYRKLYSALKAYRDTMTDTADYILGHVTFPEDKEAVREIILDLNEVEYQAVLSRIRDGDTPAEEGAEAENPTP